ncbi:MAG: 2-C-methyl-D-erythritol 2,4-cyclodiphosphate synthase [Chloroflexi bacterium]|nr:2-C-methyl-D-erythritol 2,4-cyclodiphosphate synthase [Chloroflexota bacterium]
MRIGFGYDIHPLAQGRRLVLGGVDIPFSLGLQGHSDADALCHAVMDALLGAAGLPDIGVHFPNDDPRYKDASSLELLRQVGQKVAALGYQIGNIDATIVAQEPRLSHHFPEMRRRLAQALEVNEGQIGIKATTPEGLLFAGRGMAAYAVALLERSAI